MLQWEIKVTPSVSTNLLLLSFKNWKKFDEEPRNPFAFKKNMSSGNVDKCLIFLNRFIAN